MARYIGNKCKLCRREGMKLFLKGQRCFTDKCALSRRDYPPGVHARARLTDSASAAAGLERLLIGSACTRPVTNA